MPAGKNRVVLRPPLHPAIQDLIDGRPNEVLVRNIHTRELTIMPLEDVGLDNENLIIAKNSKLVTFRREGSGKTITVDYDLAEKLSQELKGLSV